VNDVLAQISVKVNDVLAHPGKRCRGIYQLSTSDYPINQNLSIPSKAESSDHPAEWKLTYRCT